MSVEAMRRTLIMFTIREYPVHKSEYKTYLDILEWQKMEPDKVKEWYDKFFTNEK